MVQTAEERWELQFALVAKVEQCRRLARQVDDPIIAQRLLALADEYVRQIKSCPNE
jgi:hypothetical protein